MFTCCGLVYDCSNTSLCDFILGNSFLFLQSKGEALLSLVRELAQSDEGISPDLWEEYGELLEAYDNEVALQQYLVSCAKNDAAQNVLAQNEAEVRDGTRRLGFLADTLPSDSSSVPVDALQHALSPWLWCDHCKQELERAQKHDGLQSKDLTLPHWLNHLDVSPNLSSLPLPSPSVIMDPGSTRVSALLPMLPMPNGNDSDCDDLHDKADHEEEISATSTIISTENSIPRGIVFRHYPSRLMEGHQNSSIPRSAPTVDSLSSSSGNSSSNADDSGNASAGSTASFASDTIDLGSRNSSCDSGSPKPPISTENQVSTRSSPFFFHPRNGGKNKFTFHSNGTRQFSKTDQSQTWNKKLSKPVVPTKPVGLKPPPCDSTHVDPPKRLTRSNSGRSKRSARATPDIFNKRATSFGKGAIKAPSLYNPIAGPLKKPFVSGDLTLKHSSIKEAAIINNIKQKQPNKSISQQSQHSSTTKTCRAAGDAVKLQNGRHSPASLAPMHFSVFADLKSKYSPAVRNSYDNDSDTGLSSLHSTDSCDRLHATTGETLV